jgi:hypothetical protein
VRGLGRSKSFDTNEQQDFAIAKWQMCQGGFEAVFELVGSRLLEWRGLEAGWPQTTQSWNGSLFEYP